MNDFRTLYFVLTLDVGGLFFFLFGASTPCTFPELWVKYSMYFFHYLINFAVQIINYKFYNSRTKHNLEYLYMLVLVSLLVS